MDDIPSATPEARMQAIKGLRDAMRIVEAGNTRWSAFVAQNLQAEDLTGLPAADDPYWIEVAGWYWATYTLTLTQQLSDLGRTAERERDPADNFTVWAILLSTVTRLPGLAGRLDTNEAIETAVQIAGGIMDGLPIPDELWRTFRQMIPPRPSDPPGTSLDEVLERGNIRVVFIRAVIDAYNEAAAAMPGARPAHRRVLPDIVSQTTAMEVRQASQALAEGPLGRHWVEASEASGEVALYHIVPSVPIQVRLAPDTSAQWGGRSVTTADLWHEVRRAGLTATIMLQVLVGLVIENERITLSLDEIIRLVGIDPRSSKERREQRKLVWHWLKLASRCQVMGERKGKFVDRETGKRLNLESRSPLISITEIAIAKQPSLDSSEVPVEVEIVAGAFLARFRTNRKILTDLANVRKIANIPAGTPSGALAQSAGMALHQLWREQADDAVVNIRTGEDNHLTVRTRKPLTRRKIFSLFPPNPPLEERLASKDPQRAKRYCEEAFDLLREHEIIGYWKALEPLPKQRKGWQEAWLDQPLDIRATPEVMKRIAEIAAGGRRYRKKSGQSKSAKPR